MVEGKKNLPSETETMRLEDGFDALDALMGCLSQSEEWAYIQRHDALALKAEDVLYKQLERIKGSSGFECYEELENASRRRIIRENHELMTEMDRRWNAAR